MKIFYIAALATAAAALAQTAKLPSDQQVPGREPLPALKK
jgi:hypothetical protein